MVVFLRVEASCEADTACLGYERDLGNIDWTSLGDDPLGELRIFAGMRPVRRPCGSDSGTRSSTEVAAMLDAIREFDAFDVIELMRLREIPVVAGRRARGGHDGVAAAIDLGLARLPVTSGQDARRHGPANRPSRTMRSPTCMLVLRDCCGSRISCIARPPCSPRMIRWLAWRRSTSRIWLASASSGTTRLKRSTMPRSLAGLMISSLLQEHLGFTFGEFTDRPVRHPGAVQPHPHEPAGRDRRHRRCDARLRARPDGGGDRGLPRVDVGFHVPSR